MRVNVTRAQYTGTKFVADVKQTKGIFVHLLRLQKRKKKKDLHLYPPTHNTSCFFLMGQISSGKIYSRVNHVSY